MENSSGYSLGNEKVLLEIMESKISEKEKIEKYDSYGSFISGFCSHLEEKYSYIKMNLKRSLSQNNLVMKYLFLNSTQNAPI